MCSPGTYSTYCRTSHSPPAHTYRVKGKPCVSILRRDCTCDQPSFCHLEALPPGITIYFSLLPLDRTTIAVEAPPVLCIGAAWGPKELKCPTKPPPAFWSVTLSGIMLAGLVILLLLSSHRRDIKQTHHMSHFKLFGKYTLDCLPVQSWPRFQRCLRFFLPRG